VKTRNLAWTAAALLIVPALGLGALLLDPTGFPFWRGGEYSDLLISHWPIAAFIRESFAAWHQLPLWNPMILSGMPLTADPLAGFWYAPNILGWISTSGLGFNLLLWAHLGFAACGVMWLLRSEGASPAAALLGGIVFAATPKLVGSVSLGHLTLVEAVCWTPWILLAIRNAIERGLEPAGRSWRFGVAGALIGLTFLIDPRWLIPAALLSFAYAGKCIAHSQPRQGRIGLWRSMVACLIGLGVAAPGLIPLVELLPKTTRWGITADVAGQISLPPARLIGSMLFDGGGSPETQTYLGATVVLLLAVGAAASIQRVRFWTATLVVGVLLALGSFTPLYGWVMRIVPGMSSLRVPARFYLIVALAAGMLAGHAFDRLHEAASDAAGMRRTKLAAIGVGALLLMLSLMSFLLRVRETGDAIHPQAWAGLPGGVLAAGAAACAFALSGGAGGGRLARPMLIALLALDLGMANAFTLRVEPAETLLQTGTCALAGAPGNFGERRTFSPSYSLPQQLAPPCNLELADGVNPLQLTAYRNAMASATGFDTGTYSVTLPPFADGDVRSDWHPIIDAGALGLFNVDRIVSAYPLDSPGLELLTQQEGQWVYRNLLARPRAWVEPQGASGGAWRPVLALDWTPNRIRVRADGPGKLVLSEIAYPGWGARVDGVPVATATHASVLRSVALDAGTQEVVFTFVPTSLAWGAGLGALALIALLLLKALRR
jgi:hypothetical protein